MGIFLHSGRFDAKLPKKTETDIHNIVLDCGGVEDRGNGIEFNPLHQSIPATVTSVSELECVCIITS
jgi:hypothetical protein